MAKRWYVVHVYSGFEKKIAELAPLFALGEVAEHAVDFWLSTEDLPAPENRVTLTQDGDIALIFNTTEGWQSLKDSQPIRASALGQRIPYFTTAPASLEAAKAIAKLSTHSLEVRPLQSYYSQSHN